MHHLVRYYIILLLVLHVITLSSCSKDVDAAKLASIVKGRGRSKLTFNTSYFYSDGVTHCNACKECSSSSTVENLFTGSEDYCVKCDGDLKCYTEIIMVQVDFDFDNAWSLKYHSIISSSYSRMQ